ncbi:MAG: MAPEG family protein [Hyphomicrobiaceae bacterium]
MLIVELLLPVFVQVAMTLVLLTMTGRARVGAIKQGEVRMADVALGQSAWPPRVMQMSRAYQNQFELPLLFYVAVVIALITKQADIIVVVLAWVFVALRIVHAYIHVTSNHVPTRFNAFLAGMIVLSLMWIYLAIQSTTGGLFV